ncbi:Translation initiation factor eIF-2B subunit delta [Wickerhamomyces ciferrii]|uniref:Translation initiation factor eIF2B subunit delta n=1 Tax=Wickerhamomyces ciferrii (strain ATCC 14091 / BCRC 22168 / CBS 111 / JCM 3599 / NBRC 0793 / NRRL Y-1031 F-60-10) TaxID=1206466 RepID=K0KQK6_WICCF|nr:Translation initiation factor eIF-2B subunit delta [Wickerhamomyces ciferrii]CCH45331.1 Translation initiation factor eIF-2B subunit delta [Wickerhamomyces ciferrii]
MSEEAQPIRAPEDATTAQTQPQSQSQSQPEQTQPQSQPKAQNSNKSKPQSKDASSKTQDTSASGEKKLTNKELKELKKKEKLEKRAAKKESQGIPNQTEQSKAKQQKNQQQQGNQSNGNVGVKKEPKIVNKVPLFSHLETKEERNALSSSQAQVLHYVHPAILTLTSKYASYSIVGSIPRCIAMLKAFQTVISEYQTPEGTTLTRNLTSYLGYQIDYLKTARLLSVTMGNAIRWLKQEISLISIDTSDNDAKEDLIEKIDTFLKEKIELSDKLIIEQASNHIVNGSKILTFGNSNVLKELFLHNSKVLKKQFQVIIVDSRPLFEGKKLAKELTSNGLKVQYALINSITSIFQDVDTVFLGAHAMLSNGFLYSRVGAALIAMTAKKRNIPVLVCCESIKFSDRVQLDSVTLNELGDNEDLVDCYKLNHTKKSSVAMKNFINSYNETEEKQSQQQQQKSKKNQSNDKEKETTNEKDEFPLQNYQKSPHLNILNIMYDATPPDYIQKVITEVGALPPSSVPVILREYKAS